MVAKLYFYYSAMNAGKSTTLLQSSYNYNERGMHTMLFLPELIGKSQVVSRIGLTAPAIAFKPDFDFYKHLRDHQEKANAAAAEETSAQRCGCVLVDECQFLTKDQVQQLCRIVCELNTPALCYGLRTDFLGEPFEGSKYLLCWADILTEIKTICHCGRKATMNQRVTASGEAVVAGDQVEVGGNERYIGRCRKHWQECIDAAEAKLAAQKEAKKEGKRPFESSVAAEGSPDQTIKRVRCGAESGVVAAGA